MLTSRGYCVKLSFDNEIGDVLYVRRANRKLANAVSRAAGGGHLPRERMCASRTTFAPEPTRGLIRTGASVVKRKGADRRRSSIDI